MSENEGWELYTHCVQYASKPIRPAFLADDTQIVMLVENRKDVFTRVMQCEIEYNSNGSVAYLCKVMHKPPYRPDMISVTVGWLEGSAFIPMVI